MGWNSQGAQLRHVVETGDRNAANVVVVQRAGNRETQIKVFPTWYKRPPGLHLDSSGYSQNLQRPQSSERPLLYTADVVFIQLTGEKKNTTQQPVKYLKELHDTVIWLCSQFACVVLLPLISSFLYFNSLLCVCACYCVYFHTQVFEVCGSSEGSSWDGLDEIFTQVPEKQGNRERQQVTIEIFHLLEVFYSIYSQI